MDASVHAILLLATAAVGVVVIGLFRSRTWSMEGIVQGAVFGLVAGSLISVLITPMCGDPPTPWAQVWVMVTLGSIGWVLLVPPWRLVFFVAMVGIAVGLGAHFFSLVRLDTVPGPDASATMASIACAAVAKPAKTWHSIFTGL